MAQDKETRTIMDAMYSLADTLAEQRLLLRSIEANTRGMLDLWQRARGEGIEDYTADAVTPDSTPAPATSAATPSAGAPAGGGLESLVETMVLGQLGVTKADIAGKSESDLLALMAAKGLIKPGAAGATPPAGAPPPPIVP